MSIRVIDAVFERSKTKQTARLVALFFADRASEDGSDVYPSIALLQAKTNASRTAVKNGIKQLIALGEIEQTGNRRSGTRVYRFTDAILQGTRAPKPSRTSVSKGSQDPVLPETDSAPGHSDSAARGSDVGPEPSYEPSRNPSINRGVQKTDYAQDPDNSRANAKAYELFTFDDDD